MSHVDGEDDESTDNELEEKPDHKIKTPHIIAGEDSEEDDTPVPTSSMAADKMVGPRKHTKSFDDILPVVRECLI